jgi:undecaprenyl diphosphate synthase
MKQSPFVHDQKQLHVAIIMDGNGRWATARGLPRILGHRAGATALRRTVEAAPALGIGTLTIYAFSSDNWRRPAPEVDALMRLFQSYLLNERKECMEKGLRVSVLGRRDRLPPLLVREIEETERATREGTRLHLRVAVDYSSRDAILRASARLRGRGQIPYPEFSRLLDQVNHSQGSAPELDLLIRTGGEQRLSDFLLWEAAYAELYFSRTMWPDFGEADLRATVAEFHSRQRRFGGLPEAAAG